MVFNMACARKRELVTPKASKTTGQGRDTSRPANARQSDSHTAHSSQQHNGSPQHIGVQRTWHSRSPGPKVGGWVLKPATVTNGRACPNLPWKHWVHKPLLQNLSLLQRPRRDLSGNLLGPALWMGDLFPDLLLTYF